MLQIPLENKQLHHTFELYEKNFKALSDKKKVAFVTYSL